MSWAGHLACVGTGEGHTVFWYERREGKRPLGRARYSFNNIRMYLLEVVWRAMDWIGLGPGRDTWRAFVNAMMNFWFP